MICPSMIIRGNVFEVTATIIFVEKIMNRLLGNYSLSLRTGKRHETHTVYERESSDPLLKIKNDLLKHYAVINMEYSI